MKEKHLSLPVILVLLIAGVGVATAVVYWSGTQTVEQTVTEIATGYITNVEIIMPNIDEATPATIDNVAEPKFERALHVDVSSPPRTLKALENSANSTLENYDDWKIEIIADEVPSGAAIKVGDTVIKIEKTVEGMDNWISSPGLDIAGDYWFDYKVTVTAAQVTADATQTFSIDLTVE